MTTLTVKMTNTEESDQELAMRVQNINFVSVVILLLLVQTVSLKKEIEDLQTTKGVLQQDLQSMKAQLQHTRTALEEHIASLEVYTTTAALQTH